MSGVRKQSENERCVEIGQGAGLSVVSRLIFFSVAISLCIRTGNSISQNPFPLVVSLESDKEGKVGKKKKKRMRRKWYSPGIVAKVPGQTTERTFAADLEGAPANHLL